MQENTDFSKMTEMSVSRTYARSSGKLCASSIVETPRQADQYYLQANQYYLHQKQLK